MLNYIIKRLVIFIPTLFIIITATFFLVRAAPGNPFEDGRLLPPEVKANILKSYGLDQPLIIQYKNYLINILQGDFGPSFKIKDYSVFELIAKGAPASFVLGISAIILAFIVGVFLGGVAALRQNSKTDHYIMTFSMVGIVMPNFALAPLLVLLFAVYLHILPVSGWHGLAYAILPVFTLSLPYIAYIARITRSSVLETLNTNFIKVAYAKGLPEKEVLKKHALKPSLLPVISFLGPAMAGIMTGSVIIETIFDIPGLGRYFVYGALNRDYPLVMGLVIFYAFLIILLNLVVDIIYAYLDPRIKIEK